MAVGARRKAGRAGDGVSGSRGGKGGEVADGLFLDGLSDHPDEQESLRGVEGAAEIPQRLETGAGLSRVLIARGEPGFLDRAGEVPELVDGGA